MTDLRAHLNEQIHALTQERSALPQQFDNLKAQYDSKIAEVEADAASRVKLLQDEVENLRRKVQSRADYLAGQVAALKELLGVLPAQPVGAAPRPAPVVVKQPATLPLPVEETVLEDEGGEGVYEEEYEGDESTNEVEAAEDDPADDDLANAIENASDEEAVRALLARYRKA